MKKVNIILLVTVVILCFFMPVMAETENTNDPYRGYSDEELELIRDLEQSDPDFDITNGRVISIKRIVGVMTEEGFCEKDESQNDRGTIDPSMMSMTLAVQRTQTQQTTYDYFIFTAKADWLNIPSVRSYDLLAVAWSDEFTMHASDCKAYYSTLGYVSSETVVENMTAEAGISCEVNTIHRVNGTNYPLDYAVLHAYVKKYDSTDTANVVAKYAHKTVTVGSLISTITSYPSITFAVTLLGTYDTMTKSTSFSY